MNRNIVAIGLLIALLGAGFAFMLLSGPPEHDPIQPHARQKVDPVELDRKPAGPPPVVPAPPPSKAQAEPSPHDEAAAPQTDTDTDAAAVAEAVELVEGFVELTVWPVSRDGIKGAITEVVPVIKACYDDLLQDDPTIAGRVEISFTITDGDGVGRVTDAHVLDDTTEVEALSECARKAMSALQFDPPDGGETTVSWPLVFRPTDDG